MTTKPTVNHTSTACQRAPSWLRIILPHRSAAHIHTYPVEDGAALTPKISFHLKHLIYFYMKRADLFASQCSITFCLMNLQCAGGLLVTGHCKEAPFPAPNQAQDQRGEREGAAVLDCVWEVLVVPSGGLNKNPENLEDEQCPLLKTKTTLSVFFSTKLPFIVWFV